MTQINALDLPRRHTVKVELSNGKNIITQINGTTDNIVKYYIGSSLNVGECGVDDLATGEKIFFRDSEGFWMQHHKTFIAIYKCSHGYVVDHGDKIGLEVHSYAHNGSKYYIDDRRKQLLAIGNHGAKWARFIQKEF